MCFILCTPVLLSCDMIGLSGRLLCQMLFCVLLLISSFTSCLCGEGKQLLFLCIVWGESILCFIQCGLDCSKQLVKLFLGVSIVLSVWQPLQLLQLGYHFWSLVLCLFFKACRLVWLCLLVCCYCVCAYCWCCWACYF